MKLIVYIIYTTFQKVKIRTFRKSLIIQGLSGIYSVVDIFDGKVRILRLTEEFGVGE
jgi:hypothetical protein